jgi:hypothetical protein
MRGVEMPRAFIKRFGRLGAWGATGLLLIFVASGCGPAKNNVVVTGKVTYKGEPVTGGVIKLYSSDATPVPGGGDSSFRIQIKPDGTYAASNLPTGPMKVAIETDSVKRAAGPVRNSATGLPAGVKPPSGYVPPKQEPAPAANVGTQPKYVQIPARYAQPETSGLTWDVKGPETKDFDLTD